MLNGVAYSRQSSSLSELSHPTHTLSTFICLSFSKYMMIDYDDIQGGPKSKPQSFVHIFAKY